MEPLTREIGNWSRAHHLVPLGLAATRERAGGHALVALLGVCLQLGLQRRKLGERRVGVGLLLAARRRLAVILVVVAVLLVLAMTLAMTLALALAMVLRKGRRPISGTPFAARFGT